MRADWMRRAACAGLGRIWSQRSRFPNVATLATFHAKPRRKHGSIDHPR